MRKQLILAGGGHAHLYTLARLPAFFAAGIDVTCIAPSPFLSYSGMGPGLLAGRYAPEDLRFAIKELVENPAAAPGGPDMPQRGHGTFVQGRVTGIDPEKKVLYIEGGNTLAYDAVSFGLGSVTALDFPVEPATGVEVYPVKPIENLLAARLAIESRAETGEPVRVVVVGGGSSAFEVAGNALALLAGCGLKEPFLTVVVGRGLLRRFPLRAARLAADGLRRRGARLVPGRVRRLAGDRVELVDGGGIRFDVCLLATGTRPPALFARHGLALAADGGLSVNACLQSPLYPEIFGGGDCIQFAPAPLPRAGVFAVRQGPVLFANLLAFLTGGALTPFRRTGTNFLSLLNAGDGRAILRKGPLVLEGRWCMALKDAIDRRFVRAFRLPPPPA